LLPGEKIAPVCAAAGVKDTMDGNIFQSNAPHKRTYHPRWNLGQEPRASGVHQTADLFVWPFTTMLSKSRSRILDEE
jgi:hypothetical protein